MSLTGPESRLYSFPRFQGKIHCLLPASGGHPPSLAWGCLSRSKPAGAGPVFLKLHRSHLPFICDYTGPTQILQDDLPPQILYLIASAKAFLSHEGSYLQVPGVRTWTIWGEGQYSGSHTPLSPSPHSPPSTLTFLQDNIWILIICAFVCSFSPLLGCLKLQRSGILSVLPTLCSQDLEQCLAHSRCSIKTCWGRRGGGGREGRQVRWPRLPPCPCLCPWEAAVLKASGTESSLLRELPSSRS